MREITLGRGTTSLPVDTFLIYGETGSGKTTWSGGTPRPLFLSVADEGGWTSLEGLTEEQQFEPGLDPIIWEISEMPDMALSIEKARPLIASHRIKTIVLSSLTFYADQYLAHLIRVYGATDMRKVYGELGIHLRDIRTRIHNLGVNVVWEAISAAPEAEGNKPGRASIPGAQGDKFPAGVGYIFNMRVEETRKDGKVVGRAYKAQTAPTGGYMARCRIGQALTQLPNPLYGGYRAFLEARGYDVDALIKQMPKIGGAAKAPTPVARPVTTPIARPVTTPKPPVAAAKPITTTTNTSK